MKSIEQALRESLSYDPETGIITSKQTGKPVGGVYSSGYHQLTFRGKTFKGHRVAWFLMTDTWPRLVDHKNRVRSDNRWDNLREANHHTNAVNAPVKKIGDLPRGVTLTHSGRYRARLRSVETPERHIGVFDTPELASEAYQLAFDRIYGAEWRHDAFTETTITN